MKKYMKYLLSTIVLMAITNTTQAAVEKFLQTRKGTAIAVSSQSITDPYYGDLVAGGGSVSSFKLNSSEVGMRLYFDDALKTYYGSNWSITVTYTAYVYSNTGALTTYTGQTLTIGYNTTGTYTDMQIKKFTGSRARFDITAVNRTGIAAVPNDVFIDYTCDVDRTYKISTTSTPKIKGDYNASNNTYTFAWPHIYGAESYDLEYLFIDYGTTAFTTHLPIYFKNATRINTTDQTYTINMVYPRGRLLFRIRGVGYSTTTAGLKEYSPWSYDPTPGTTTPPADVSIITSLYDQYYDYAGFEDQLNWSYSASFSEYGTRTDNVAFMDDLMRGRQSVTMNQDEQRPIVSQTIYDFVGRPAIQVLPSPIKWDNNTGIDYYTDLTMTDHSGGSVVVDYDYKYFDTDSKTANPDDVRASGSKGAGYYYSNQNTSEPGHNAKYIPDAEGYPYVRTQYLNDGTNRVKSQSGVGDEYKPNSTHEVKILYGGVAGQQELDRLFGNEAGLVNLYSKEAILDANGQTTVKYIDNEGRIVATALAGDAPANLRNIDSKPTSFATLTSDLDKFNQLTADDEWVVNHSFIVAATGNYTFDYELFGDTVCNNCIDYDAGAPVQHCTDCYYDVYIKVTNNDDGTVIHNASYSNIHNKTPKVTFVLNLTPGSYTVYKKLSLNSTFLANNVNNFETNQNCIALATPDGGDCAPSCTTMCEQEHSYIDPLTGNTVWFEQNDDATNSVTVLAIERPNGTFVSGNQTAVDNLVNPCVTSCNAIPSPSDIYPCDYKLSVLKLDMSPGGQYFDNLPDFFDGGAYNINGWITGKTIPTPITSACTTCTTWPLVRANWVDSWADHTVKLHPEYCAWERECECQGATYADIKAFFETFEDANPAFYSSGTTINSTATYFNPTRITQNTTASPTGSPNYQPFNVPSVSDAVTDDLIECLGGTHRTALNTMLRQFVPNHPTAPTDYFSIWYLLRDPDGIAYDNGNNHNATVHDDVEKVFDYIHGNAAASPTIPGLIGTGTNQISEAEFFRRAYLLLRKKVLYDHANGCTNLYLADTDGDGKTDGSTKYDIRYPLIALFEEFPFPFTSTSMADLETGVIDPAMEDACQPYIDEYMAAVTTACGTTIPSGTLTAMQGHLMTICTGSDPENFYYTYNVLETGTITVNSTACSTFVQVIQSYQSTYSCLSSVVYPSVPEQYNQAKCACENFSTFLYENSLTLSSASATIQSTLTASDLLSGSENPTTGNIDTWKTQCSGSTPNYSTLTSNGLIEAFKCPANLDNTQDLDQWIEDCNAAMDALALFNATNTYQDQLNALVEDYQAQVYNSCLDTGVNKLNERFNMSYSLPEYHYTLYFYDQAGNLVKTVSPEGVNRTISGTTTFTSLLTGTTLVDVQDHRNNPGTDPFTHPNHQLKTGYKYNSLNQLTERSTADEGKSTYFYDYLGRLAVSQNAKQAANNQYSVVQYDELSRETEAFVITQGTTLTQTIASTTGTASGSLQHWITNGTSKIEVTKIFYDEEMHSSIAALISPVVQTNLRNRISSVTYTQTAASPIGSLYDYATHYTYDIHGNVKSVVHDYQPLARFGQNIKRIDYEYELVSGNVTKLSYQPGKYDQYYHQYYYDKNNQLEEVYTSKDALLWERDADYFYQTTGQLARHEQGSRSVNGTDYAYTIQGWLKGVNSNTLNRDRDMGKDGNLTAASAVNKINQHYGQDAYGYTIGYYQGDYTPIGGAGYTGTNAFEASTAGNTLYTKTKSNLYNGNIGHVVLSQQTTNTSAATRRTLGKAYEYDQLNRLMDVETNQAIDATGNDWDTYAASTAFKEYDIKYDGNGNILNFKRGGASLGMDNLTYNYTLNGSGALTHNRLSWVDDAIAQCNFTTDIDDHNNANYVYDQLGQLTKDNGEFITDIFWFNDGKVRRVIKDKAVNTKSSVEVAKNDAEYIYDALGYKICKIDKPHKAAGTGLDDQSKYRYTWYINDEKGNVLTTYEQIFENTAGVYSSKISQEEINIYGLDHEATVVPVDRIINYNLTGTISFTSTQTETLSGGAAYNESLFNWAGITVTAVNSLSYNYTNYIAKREAGYKLFELNNHLGSTVSVTTDRKRSYDDNADNIVDRYYPEIDSWIDTYAFGSILEQGILGQKYRKGFQQSEKYDELYEGAYDFGERLYDSRIGRFFSTDPESDFYDWQSPYVFAGNNPVTYIDQYGEGWLDWVSEALDWIPGVGYVKGVVEAAVGYDLAGNELSAVERASRVIPIPGSKYLGKTINYTIKKLAPGVDKIIHKVDDWLLDKVTNKVMKKMSEKLPKKIKPNKLKGDIGEGVWEKKLGKLYSNSDRYKILKKPHVKINGEKGIGAYPDFVIIDKKTGKVVKIVDSKTGKGALTKKQEKLNEKGGVIANGKKRDQSYNGTEVKAGSIEAKRVTNARVLINAGDLKATLGSIIQVIGEKFRKKHRHVKATF